jgi:hypothetical protein
VMGEGFTFSNGVFVPPGTAVATPSYPIHHDEKIYPNPNKFDGFRFSRMREKEGEGAKHHASSTSLDFLYFGHGQHGWYAPLPLLQFASCEDSSEFPPFGFAETLIVSPGRFFAVNEIKLMFAYTLMNFDVKTKDGKRPPNFEFHSLILPNTKAEILYRRRALSSVEDDKGSS